MNMYQKLEHSPTLNTILLVEHILKSDSLITIPQLKKKLNNKINHNTLKVILDYLEQSHKIVITMKGITWVENNNPKMQEALRKSYRYPEDFPN
jgi:hypothetical protein